MDNSKPHVLASSGAAMSCEPSLEDERFDLFLYVSNSLNGPTAYLSEKVIECSREGEGGP
jgi:hypothetical protein